MHRRPLRKSKPVRTIEFVRSMARSAYPPREYLRSNLRGGHQAMRPGAHGHVPRHGLPLVEVLVGCPYISQPYEVCGTAISHAMFELFSFVFLFLRPRKCEFLKFALDNQHWNTRYERTLRFTTVHIQKLLAIKDNLEAWHLFHVRQRCGAEEAATVRWLDS